MSDKLAALQAQYKEKEVAEEKRKNGDGNTDWYKFWDMDFDETATIRFLPDSNPDNPHFIQEKWVHKLDVEVDGKTQKRFVACINHEHYGKQKCPICAASQNFYNEKSDDYDEKLGSKFWRKISFIANIVVIDSPFEFEGPAQKLINFEGVTKIPEAIKKAIMSGDLDDYPTEIETGYNFRLNSIKDGQWAAYTTSNFAPKQTAIPANLQEGLEEVNLSEKLPKEPDMEYIEAVLHAALTGEPFEYKAPKKGGDDATAVTSKPVAAKVEDTVDDEVKETVVAEKAKTKVDVMDIVARRKKEGAK